MKMYNLAANIVRPLGCIYGTYRAAANLVRLKSEGANQALKGSNSVCKVGFSSMPDSGAPKLKA